MRYNEKTKGYNYKNKNRQSIAITGGNQGKHECEQIYHLQLSHISNSNFFCLCCCGFHSNSIHKTDMVVDQVNLALTTNTKSTIRVPIVSTKITGRCYKQMKRWIQWFMMLFCVNQSSKEKTTRRDCHSTQSEALTNS